MSALDIVCVQIEKYRITTGAFRSEMTGNDQVIIATVARMGEEPTWVGCWCLRRAELLRSSSLH